MNWAGPANDDMGTELTDAFWQAGYYADLIPSSEVRDQGLRVDAEGNIWYGRQRYAAVVLYHLEFETAATAEFFRKAAKGKAIFYRIGDWTRNFAARPFDGHAALPNRIKPASDVSAWRRPSSPNFVTWVSKHRHRKRLRFPSGMELRRWPRWANHTALVRLRFPRGLESAEHRPRCLRPAPAA